MKNAVSAPQAIDTEYQLDDRYTREKGRVFLSGSQALVRLPIMQRQRDETVGKNTAGFISGYTGSPLGGYDIALKQAGDLLDENHIHFQPGVNEDLGATAVWGSQQIGLVGEAKYDGVFGIWYGKGPGVDRSGDALKHGSYSGSAPNGGVLVLAGDDHGAKSSTTAHQSDHAFIHFGMPYFNPATVQDYLDYGLHGFAMSRFSGCWIGMKCVTDTIESSASVTIDPGHININIPDDSNADGHRNTRWGVPALVAEKRQYQERLPAVQTYIRANELNRTIIASDVKNLAIVTTGKAFLDVMQALDELGLNQEKAARIGISVYKIAMPWPLEPEGIAAFIRANKEVLVVEEKRPIIEDQLAHLLVNMKKHPLLLGKHDDKGLALVPQEGELSSKIVADIIHERLSHLHKGQAAADMLQSRKQVTETPSAKAASLSRLPSFCAGCPHNRSTKLPDGSMAFGGIGCHGMATFLPERNTPTLFQMGGEGAPWIGIAPFTNKKHLFQNLGDGTYYHSGLLAIRAAVAAKVNITYKILVNNAIAMTGGQDIEGEMRVDALSKQVKAEGVVAIAIVSDDLDGYTAGAEFAPGTKIHHRDDMDIVQRKMRDIAGVTAIIYDQNCATELRRKRKRGKAKDPDHRPFINSRVCEGCGDCSVQSNCIAIEPVETQFGRKRKINQSSCNKDFSCVEGYCPSFVTVHGGQPRKRAKLESLIDHQRLIDAIPWPKTPTLVEPFSLLVTGIGGSGVVTLGSILGMAAHLEGKGCSVLDVTGLAQRNGPVASHVKFAARPDDLKSTRIAAADLVVGTDIVTTASADILGRMVPSRTQAIVNNRVAPTSDFASEPDLDLSSGAMEQAITSCTDTAEFEDVTTLAYALMGNEVAANLMLIGFAIQRGWLPITLAGLERAIELNGTAVEMNKSALAWGRILAHDPAKVKQLAAPNKATGRTVDEQLSLDELISNNTNELVRYQNAAYADRYKQLVETVRQHDEYIEGSDFSLTRSVAQYYFKMLAFKDEYEVARLLSSDAFRTTLEQEFEGDFRMEFHMAPPIFQRRDPRTGRYPKRRFGQWMIHPLRLLARLRFLRGTHFDIFGYTQHRKTERRLIRDYEEDIANICTQLTPENYATCVSIASLPEIVRGYDTVKDASIAHMYAEKKALLADLPGSTTEPKQISPRPVVID